jgi:N-acetylglucosamine kinase-like BadF-type ATPase
MVGIGIDTGGSRTTYAIRRGDGTEARGGSEAGASLADARGADSSLEAIRWMLDVVRQENDDEVVVWIGAAGFSAVTREAIRKRFADHAEAFEKEFEGRRLEILIANDGVSILKAPPLFGIGLAAIVGTGSVVMGWHPSCPEGVIKRGGAEWIASDEGAGVWIGMQCVRMLLRDIQFKGSDGYHSVLLDRLTDYFRVPLSATKGISASHRAMAKAELIARHVAEDRPDTKRYLASFVWPHVFDLAAAGPSHDQVAADVLDQSVGLIAKDIKAVSDAVSAHTCDAPGGREKLPLVIGGNIAANPVYRDKLLAVVDRECRFVASTSMIGDAAGLFAELAHSYAVANRENRRALRRSLDPLHPVDRLR